MSHGVQKVFTRKICVDDAKLGEEKNGTFWPMRSPRCFCKEWQSVLREKRLKIFWSIFSPTNANVRLQQLVYKTSTILSESYLFEYNNKLPQLSTI